MVRMFATAAVLAAFFFASCFWLIVLAALTTG